ncbi:helix-turn-helix domain-containing protein [Caloramator sp. ALD01]|uniref:helix-turn-helix domain-containing protein n=1 Tax=Caloramator sp. ALD01 TaxID=1031288 RepID=UPI00040F2F36|nr:helix-turn-helix transcriptional regulator [Caloramator sp. ALD01]
MFGSRLKMLREEKGLKQKDLAKIIGISDRTIGMYEQGRREPDFETLIKIADHFGVTTDYLLGRTDNPRGMIVSNKENEKFNQYLPEELRKGDVQIEIEKEPHESLQLSEEELKFLAKEFYKEFITRGGFEYVEKLKKESQTKKD